MLGGDEKFDDFITWFTSNISSDNTIVDLEIVEYNELLADEKTFSSVELQEEMKCIEMDYPNVWSTNGKDAAKLERQLEDLCATEEFLEELAMQLK